MLEMETSLLSKILCVFTLSGICFGATDFAEKYLQRSYKECQSKAMSGRDYKGRVNVTKDGVPCQRWNESEPHKHPFSYVGDHNYCRNPIEAPVSEVFCYTSDPNVRYQFCSVPFCPPLQVLDFSLDNDMKPDEENEFTNA